MDKKLKRALLYSALGCPGIGHWMMGQRAKGAALVVATTGMLVVFCWRLVNLMMVFYQALLADVYESGDVLMDPSSIRSMHSRIYLDNWWVILVILALWAVALADLYRLRGASLPSAGGSES